MSHRPVIRVANFLPLAVKFITVLTGYHLTRPHGTQLNKTCVIYKLLYRIKKDVGLFRDADVRRGVPCFSGYFSLSGNYSSPTSDFLKEG